jgi:hypothetical protein
MEIAMRVFGEWFDAQALARHVKSKSPYKLMRAHIVYPGKNYAVRQYVYVTSAGQYWSYRRLANGNIRESYFDILKSNVIHIEEIPS